MIDSVHIGEIVIGAHAMLGHHAAHGGAIAAIVVLLDPARFLWRSFEPGADELADPDVDLLPQIDVMRIKRVVEIEHPGVDAGESAGDVHHLTNPQPSSLRKQGPILRGGHEEHGASYLRLRWHYDSNSGRWLWVPAFAGTTEITASR